MTSTKTRLQRQEARLTGNVTFADDGIPVIQTPDGKLQVDGYFIESLRHLDAGRYRLLAGPEVPFDLFWDSGDGWEKSIRKMQKAGHVYVPVNP